MKLTLVLKQNREKSVQVPKEVSILGRSSECDIVVPDMSVSRKHCIITQKDGAVNIEDLGSTNHTNVPGKDLMEKGDGAIVKHGDTIKIGNIELIIQIDDQPLPDDDDAPIKLAEENQLRTLALPATGTGIAGFGLKECAQIMLEEVLNHLATGTGLKDVYFILFDEAARRVFQDVHDKLTAQES